ncbi:MAG: hypothetical protein HY904_14670 [Deltaproteobacteria bacterium]|nr:hypothetical protein [Deltaproteobacteria bacterium]
MSQKKAAPPAKAAAPAKAPPAAAKPAPKPAGPAKTVAYDPALIEGFIMGRITLGELEGIGKDIQYEMAKKGYAVLNQGRLEQAKVIFKGLLALDPYDSYFHTAHASCLQREGNYDEAEHAYTIALKFNPYNSAAYANRGEIRFQQGKVFEAAEDLKQAIVNDPKAKDPATVRARALSIAISEVIKQNQDVILAELKKAQDAAKKGGKGAKAAPTAKAAPAKSAPAKHAAPKKK